MKSPFSSETLEKRNFCNYNKIVCIRPIRRHYYLLNYSFKRKVSHCVLNCLSFITTRLVKLNYSYMSAKFSAKRTRILSRCGLVGYLKER